MKTTILILASFLFGWTSYCFSACAEDIESSTSDYLKALSILERLVEPDSRHIASLYPSKFEI